ncbi:MAG: ATP-binding protein [Kangiellaceae bacterium]|jgi:PAS domain S-box-containing protein|nr:ATP-binding protein [Kangiellaceae bacterium]
MLAKLLNEHKTQRYVLKLTRNKDILHSDDILITLDRSLNLDKRLLHYIDYCYRHTTAFQFDQVFFSADGQPSLPIYSRRFKMVYFPDDELSVVIEPEEEYRSILFTKTFDHNILNSMSDALLITETDALDKPGPKIVYCNKAYIHMSGYSESEIIGKTPRILQGEETLTSAKRAIRQALEKWQPVTQRILNYHKDGSKFLVELNINPVKDETGWYTHWVSVQRNITKEILFEESSQLSQLALRSAEIGTWSINFSDSHLNWDNQTKQLHGFEADDHIATYNDWIQLILESDKASFEQVILQAINQHKNFSVNYRIKVKGQIRFMNCRGECIEKRGEKRIIGVVWDTTVEQKALLDVIDQKKIVAQQSKLASLGQLAAGIGHEINNPLSIINVATDFIELKSNNGTITDDFLADSTDKIKDASTRISKIVDGLRSIHKVDHSEENLHTIDLVTEVENTIVLLSDIYHEDDVELTFTPREHNALVLAEHSAIQQVIVNLISNAKDAVKKTDDKTISVDIQSANDCWLLKISDSGQGISPKDLEKIFDPFYTTKEVGEGTGLGLSITKSIIESFRGEIDIISSVNHGTQVTVRLPKTNVLIKSNLEISSRVDNHYNVLLVEDDLGVSQIVASIFNDLGCKTATASNGKKAIKILQEHDHFDLILSDINMPKMGGWELLENIDDLKLAPSATKFLMTGDVSYKRQYVTRQKDKKLADGVVEKPLTIEKINKLMQSLSSNQDLFI